MSIVEAQSSISDQRADAADEAVAVSMLLLDETDLDAAIEKSVRAYTISCITLEEITNLDALAPGRLEHVRACDFCRDLVAAVRRKPLGSAAAFLDLAVNDHCGSCGQMRGVNHARRVHDATEKAGGYAKEHSVHIAAGVAAIAVGALLLTRSLRAK